MPPPPRGRPQVKALARPHAEEDGNNARNNAMVRELKEFKEHAKALHKQLGESSSSLAASLATLRKALAQPLPRVYDRTPAGQQAEVLDGRYLQAGEGVSRALIAKASAEMQSRVQADVLLPLEAWAAAFDAIKQRNHECEALSRGLDAQRRVVRSAQGEARWGRRLQPGGGIRTLVLCDWLDSWIAASHVLNLLFTLCLHSDGGRARDAQAQEGGCGCGSAGQGEAEGDP